MSLVKERIKVGSMEIEGRVIMPPIATYKCDEEGFVTDDVCEYYASRAANPNVSLIITEHSFINKQGQAKPRQMSIADDACIPGLSRLVNTIHENGAKAVAQINHAGLAAKSEVTGMTVVGPNVIGRGNGESENIDQPRELTKEEIKSIVEDFAKAAARAKAAGYDGVEIHSAHGYLLNQFYSPLTNRRGDEYGGPVENRVRIHREVIQAVRAAVGEGYPVFIRLGACDYMEGGSQVEDASSASKLFEEAGVDLIDITGGMCGYVREGHSEPGYFSNASIAIKNEVSLPVILTGGVKTVAEAEALMESGAADLIGVGRELFKDAYWEVK